MACCVFTAYCMVKLIKACEAFDINLVSIQYNQFDAGPGELGEYLVTGKRPTVTKIALDGMTCAACVTAVEDAVSGLEGVERVSVSLPLARVTVVHVEALSPVRSIIDIIEDRGYGAKAGGRSIQENLEVLEHNAELQRLRGAFMDAVLLSSIVSGLEMLLKLDLHLTVIGVLRLSIAAVSTWVQVIDAQIVHRNALRRQLTMDTLVSLSLTMGTVLSLLNTALFGWDTSRVYWSSGSFLATVILGGRYLDTILRKRSTATFASLYQLQEKSLAVKLRKKHGERATPMNDYIDAATLEPRDEISIGPGTIIPCDCYVISGETLVDQSTMTGESVPVAKKAGDFLMSGTENLSAEVHAVVSKPQEESALEMLISSVSNATESSTMDTAADAIISRFVAVILALAVAGFAMTSASYARDNGSFMALNLASERAMAILASACPCAVGLATPSAVMAGLDAARLRGVIVDGGFETLRSLSRLTHFILDKTGTLTTGRLSVSESEGEFGTSESILVAAAERDEARTHPVARAVFKWAMSSLEEEQRGIVNVAEVSKQTSGLGGGLNCEIQVPDDVAPSVIHAGNERYLLEHGIELPHSPALLDIAGNQTFVHFAIDHEYIGTLRLNDTVRKEASAVVAHLTNIVGLQVAMLTGDVETEAKRVSESLRIPVLSSHTLPEEKRAYIQELQSHQSTNVVAMMGDGLNDSPALAAADVGICITLGLPRVVSETTNARVSSVIFTSPDLSRLPELLTIAAKTMRQSRLNMRWAIAYNIVAVALAMGVAERYGVVVDAARAGTMMAFSSISVLAWSLWLRRELSQVSFRSIGVDRPVK